MTEVGSESPPPPGELEVHYECLRRVLIKGTMGHLSSCLPLDDGPVTGDSQLEIALWKTLCEIQRLEKELGQPNAILPEALLKVCPPPEVETVPTFASRAEHQAAIWQKQSGQVLVQGLRAAASRGRVTEQLPHLLQGCNSVDISGMLQTRSLSSLEF